jgi:predicted O-linked N-acetylglucosamine transferase (SPINDLY family)
VQPIRGDQQRLTTAQVAQQARDCFRAGEYPRAEHLCRSLLHLQPDHHEALSLLGIITAQTGRAAEGAALLGRVATGRPGDVLAHNNYGNALRGLRHFEAALASYDRALALQPNSPDIHYNRANVLRDLKRHDEAVEAFARALQLNPRHLAACNNRGNALRDLGRFEEALRDFDRALQLRPDYAEAHANRANVLRETKRYDEALAGYERALRINPAYAEGWNNRGVALRAHNRPREALASYDQALALKPDYVEAHYNRANALQDLRRFTEALQSYERALQLKPDDPDAFVNRGNTLQELGRAAEAVRSFEQARQLDAQLPWLAGQLYYARMKICDWSGLEAQVAGLTATLARGQPSATPFPVLILTDSLEVQHQAAHRWMSESCPAAPVAPPTVRRAPGARIRLGYYSADFYNHATAFLAAELFERHDREHFEVIGLSFGPTPGDEMQQRLAAAFDQLIDVRDGSDQEIAQLSRELGIDIAVDLKGYTRDSRAGIFARRAAPLQVSWLGYPGTMGAPFIDYLIADHTLIPPESRHHYSEQIIYLPHSYQVNDRKRRIAPQSFTRTELGLPPEGLVFCCFNNTYKITPQVFDVWMRLLREVGGSTLWLLEDNAEAAENLRREARARGIDAARLVFAPRWPLAEHLARHRAADLFLDTFPCNAHTTASDALWAGLPVLTRTGESFASRVAASLLRAIGLPELIADSAPHYQQLALALAADSQRRTALRQQLQQQRLTTALFDTEAFTRHLESAYTTIHARHHAGLRPAVITVPDKTADEGHAVDAHT